MTPPNDEKDERPAHPTMNPSRHQLPQKVSPDRQRARAATTKLEQKRFTLVRDQTVPEDDGERRPLPPWAEDVPADVAFLRSHYVQLALAKADRFVKAKAVTALTVFRSFDKQEDYHALYRLLGGDPESLGKWRIDAELGRLRLDGVNPMHIRALRDDTRTPVWQAAERVLSGTADMRCLLRDERLYVVEYPDLWHPSVQDEVKKAKGRGSRPVRLAAPTCLFWENDGQLVPLAIQLKPRHVEEHNPVITPRHERSDWQMARAHVAAADAHLHEGFYHLLETHLVNEAVALCMYRQLHPDHPVRQLLTPHYQGTLAINETARKNLLMVEPAGPIQKAMAAGVNGTLNAARLAYRRWSFPERALRRDLEERGVMNLPNYHYRDDALELYAALERFVRMFLSLWYRGDADVTGDFELQAFIAEAGAPAGGAIPGFPPPATSESVGTRIDSRDRLVELIAHLVFRAGPQHAAVNNGQFDSYGEAANVPGRLHGKLPDEIREGHAFYHEADFWKGLPGRDAAIAQMSMVWVLSLPTRRSILHTGEFPDFDPALSFEAVEAIASLRRRLQTISYEIQERNGRLAVPYRYLDPQNVSRSTDV